MARSLEIEALNLEVRFPVREDICTHKFGLFSQPEFTLKKIDGVDSRYDPQIDSRREEDACIVSHILFDLIDGIPPSPKNVISEETRIIPSDRVPPRSVKDAIMQACNNIDLSKAKMSSGSTQHVATNCTERDHLVPENGLKWENDQESIDDLWNDMSSGQNNATKFQNGAKSTNLLHNFPRNDNSPRSIQNANDEFNFSISRSSSPEEFEGSNDLFSQMYQMKVQSKKKKIMSFGRPKLSAPDSIRQMDKQDPFKRIAEITFAISQQITRDEDNQDSRTQGHTTPKNESHDIFSQNCEQNALESIGEMALAKCSTGNLDEIENEMDIGSFLTGPSKSQVTYSQNDEQGANEKSSAETSDMFDEEIDAAIENYIAESQRKVLELSPQSSCEIFGLPQELKSCIEPKIDVGTQTVISGSIYASSNKCNCAKSSALKRSLQALCLENVVCKKPKTFILTSPNVFSTSQMVSHEIHEFGDISNAEINLDASQHLEEPEFPSESLAANKTNKDVEPSQVNMEQNENGNKEGDDIIDEQMEVDENDDETELQDQEVPRSIVIGTVPIHPPANFCWENDREEPIEINVDNPVDGGTPSKSKAPCRLRLGLSRRAKPKLSLHRTL